MVFFVAPVPRRPRQSLLARRLLEAMRPLLARCLRELTTQTPRVSTGARAGRGGLTAGVWRKTGACRHLAEGTGAGWEGKHAPREGKMQERNTGTSARRQEVPFGTSVKRFWEPEPPYWYKDKRTLRWWREKVEAVFKEDRKKVEKLEARR